MSQLFPFRSKLFPILIFILLFANQSRAQVWETSDSIVYQSTDAGSSWHPISPASFAKISSVALSPSGSVFIATLGFGIFRTTDNGAHWNPASNGIGTVSDMKTIVAAHDGTLYA